MANARRSSLGLSAESLRFWVRREFSKPSRVKRNNIIVYTSDTGSPHSQVAPLRFVTILCFCFSSKCSERCHACGGIPSRVVLRYGEVMNYPGSTRKTLKTLWFLHYSWLHGEHGRNPSHGCTCTTSDMGRCRLSKCQTHFPAGVESSSGMLHNHWQAILLLQYSFQLCWLY
jgi:hypothetical protein